MKSRGIVVLALASLAFLCFAPGTARAESTKRPNILFIFTDDHAPHAIGAYGSKFDGVTPNMDRLAREGMLFKQSFCTNSLCGPSRATILTGKFSHQHGFYTNRDEFDGSQETVAKLLQKAGYQTAVVGKWHLVSQPTGFDYYEVLIGQGPYYNPPMRTANGIRRHTGYTTDIITDLALEWLEKGRDAEKPFFLMYQHKAPHREWQPAPRHYELFADVDLPEPDTLFDDWSGRTSATRTQTMTVAEHLTPHDLKLVPPNNLTEEQLAAWKAFYEPRNEAMRAANLDGKDLVRWKYQRYIKDYLRCVKAVDEGIGRVLAWLEREGLAENTVVIYASDQGFYLGDHGWYDKRWMYEESLRMPFIIRWPGVVKPGTVDDRHMIQNIDYAETFLEIAGAPIPEAMQGRSLVPLLRGESPSDWRRSIYYHFYEFPGVHDVQRHYGVRTERHKLIRYYEIDEWELFDLEKDPDELTSVHADPAYASVRSELEAELRRLQKHYGEEEPEIDLAELGQAPLRRRARTIDLVEVLRLEKADDKERRDFDPTATPIVAGARVTPKSATGVILAQGGESLGYSLYLHDGVPTFAVRSQGSLRVVRSPRAVELGKEVHLAGALRPGGRLVLWIDGEEVAETRGLLIARKPAEPLTLGRDAGSLVGDYRSPSPFEGEIEDLRIYAGVLPPSGLRAWAKGE